MRARSPRVVACALLAAALGAQAPLATIGRFVDQNGKPVEGAEITFATSPPLVFDTFAPATVVTARTDADGRYRTELLPGRSYSAWAIGPDDAAGRARSAVREGVIAGNVVDFAVASRKARARLRILDLPNAGPGPFTALVRTGARHGVPLRLPVAKNGAVELPPVPGDDLFATLLDARGEVVVPWLTLWYPSFTVSEFRRRRFVVRDEAGAPLAGAVVLHVDTEFVGRGDEPFTVPREVEAVLRSAPTDVNGRTELRWSGRDVFLATGPGRAMSLCGVLMGSWVQDGLPQGAETPGFDDDVTFTLRPAAPLRGRLHRGPVPVPGHGVLLATALRVSKSLGPATQTSSLSHTDTVRTAADGTFELPPAAVDAYCLQVAVEPFADAAPPTLLLPRVPADTRDFDVDLAAWPVVTFQGLRADGGPAAGLRVLLLPGDPAAPVPDPLVLPADRAGRVRAQLEPGAWFVFATDGDGYAVQRCALAAGAERDERLQLRPLARLRGKLVDAAGQPVAGALFQCDGTVSMPAASDAEPLELLLRQHAQLLTRGLLQRVATGADGAFELRYLPVPRVTVHAAVMGCKEPIELNERTPEQIELRQKQ